jgi:DNA modification methylase
VTAIVIRGDARTLPLPGASVDLIVTSPPYFGLRSYTDAGQHYHGQIGSEATPREWLAAMLECTAEWVRVLKPSGSIFVNLGDKFSTGASGENGTGTSSLNGHGGDGTHRDRAVKRSSPAVRGVPPKSLLGLPWRYALACMDDLGLILRRDIIWSKPNGLPESVTDRCRSSHEYLFHFTVQPRYYAAVDEIREPHTSIGDPRWRRATTSVNPDRGDGGMAAWRDGREPNPLGKLPGSDWGVLEGTGPVWPIPSQPLTVPAHLGVDHFAAFPMELPRRVILGWSPPGVCCACGEGRHPVATPTADYQRKLDASKQHRNGSQQGWGAHGGSQGGFMWHVGQKSGETSERTITGYACACPQPGAPVRPAVVVDPFGGTGTTALVASMYGRTGISFDLSGDYCRLAAWRTTDPAERARALQVPKPPPVPDGQDSLFDLEAV